jgi:ferritin-like metal-binding protein YciE
MFVHERGIMGWNMHIEDTHPFIFEHLMMTGFLADLDLSAGVKSKDRRDYEKKEVITHMGGWVACFFYRIPHSKIKFMSNTAKSHSAKKTKNADSRLEEFFHDELKDIYWAEKHIVSALPKMKKAASSSELQSAFEEHLEVTKTHVARLEKAFELLGEKAQAKKCEAMEGILKEGDSIVDDTEDGTATRDVGLIMAAQKVEHYEIATYGSLIQVAKTLGHDDIASLFTQTLSEEKEADESLTEVAESHINYDASEEHK